ncbi:threonine tRS [Acrasis kona]|uniref:Threonine tRS n=1 Tax=Acrasis kona TaxID=1008807 RepID=A0AAW2YY54_9EUKA
MNTTQDIIIRQPIVAGIIEDQPVTDVKVFKTKKTVVKRPVVTNIYNQAVVDIEEEDKRIQLIEKKRREDHYKQKVEEIKKMSKTVEFDSKSKKNFICAIEDEVDKDGKLFRITRTYAIELV